jgi:gliding motility-associated-like protein
MKLLRILFFSVIIVVVYKSHGQTMNNNGGFITAQPGSFIYVNGSVSNNNVGILAVNGNGTPTSSELYVTQDVINNATINANGYIRLLGHWIDNNIFNSTTGTVFFEGGNQFLGGSSITQFFNITLDGTGIKTQQVDKIANGTLDLKSLHLNTDIYEFFVTNSALNSIIRTSGFVSSANGGFLSRATANTGMYLFPTGSTANTSANIPGSGTYRYRPIELNPNDGNPNVYSVRMANLDATTESFNRNSAEPIICEANPLFYHQIARPIGNSNADVGVCFIPAADGNWNDMARWNITTNGVWQDMVNVNLGNITGFTKSTATGWSNFADIPYILTNLNPSTPVINNNNVTGCAPLSINFQTNSTNGVTYTWSANGSNIGTGSSFNETFAAAGCYAVTLMASIGTCTASVTVPDLVCVDNSPNAAFTSSITTFSNPSEIVYFGNNSTGATSYVWDFGNGTTSNIPDPSVNYSNVNGNVLVTLYAYSESGCIDSSFVIINYTEEEIFYVPNTFTPDQDEFNQTWGPVFTQGFDPYNFDLYVYNRWGELIWESHDADARWDGSYGVQGTDCQEGVYTWKIYYKPKQTDEKRVEVGHVNLIR